MTKIDSIFFDSLSIAPYYCAPMLNEPLPSQIDIRKLAVKGAEFDANFPVSLLTRIPEQLAVREGVVSARLQLAIDDQGIRRLTGDVSAQIQVACQRCLQAMPLAIHSTFDLAIVWNDDEAKQLPRGLDPFIVGEELTNLTDIIEEELLLSVPIVSFHDAADCVVASNPSFGDEVVEPKPKENPFKVLDQLKPNK